DRGVVIDAAGALSSVTRIQADLAEATLAAPVDWAKAWLPALSRLDLLAGTARDASIDWTGDRGWRVAARVDRAAFALAPTEFERAFPLALRIPGGRDVDVQLQATPAGGKATLSNPKGGGQAWLTLGGVLAEPEFALNELEAQVGWTVLSSGDKSGAGLRLGLDFENVRFANADVAGHTRVRYVGNGDGGDGQLTIEGALDRAQARRVFRYLPQALPGPVRDWVRDAFESGQFEAVKFAVNGRLMAFPFRGSERPEGEFQLGGRFRDVLLRFAPGWPTIQQATGDFGFDRASLQVNGHSGTVGKSRVEGVTVTIADLGQAELMLKGSARGDAGDMVRFVNASPLAATGVGAVTRPLRADGPAQLRLAVNYPFVGSARLKVDGQIDLNGTQITFDPSQPTFADARGHLNFTAESLSFDRVTATLNGSPVEAHGRTADGSTRIEAQARLSADSLRRFVDNVLTRQLDGATDVRVSILLTDSGRTVRAESDLVGLGSRLPAPLMKAASQPRPFRFDWTPQPDAPRPTERIEATLDDDIRLIAERTAVEPGRPLLITRAAVALGRTAQLPARGLALLANLPRLDGDAWLAVFDGPMAPAPAPGSAKAASRTATAGTASTATPGADHAIGPARVAAGVGLFADDFMAEPTQIALVADELRYGNRLYRKVTLDAARSGRIWNARLQSNEIVGTLQWEYGGPAGADGRLVGRFGRLAIPNPIEGTKPLPTDRDARMPALDITADSLAIGDARLGRLELIATNLRNPAPVWRLDRLNLNSPAAAFRAGGTFRESTELDYELRIDNAGKLLEQFGFKGVVLGGSGQMSGKVRWQSVPSNFDIPTLSGDVKLDVRDGQFLKVEPGAAKLIGVLNLQALPKWLSLDFTDLFARGFAFQELSGRVKIDSGIARTETLGMRGLEAVVQIKGEADLIRQTQDVHVTILPNLDAGLATLAFAAIINPAIGLGAFLAQSLLGKQLSRAFAHEIDVKGPWVDPQVIPKRRENPSDALPTGG
ncbi:MAG: AsmA-like C-terminal region-containing protein, partial [Burkholderiaceae bacterium]